jgi:hypothetical protein
MARARDDAATATMRKLGRAWVAATRAPIKGMCRRGLEAPLPPPPREDPSKVNVGQSGHRERRRERACWLRKRAR